MKRKWKITYWDNDTDCAMTIYSQTYEDAITKVSKLQNKGHSNVQVKLNGGQP